MEGIKGALFARMTDALSPQDAATVSKVLTRAQTKSAETVSGMTKVTGSSPVLIETFLLRHR